MSERIEQKVWVSLSEVIEHNLEGFLDLLAERAGFPLLMDIDYSIVRWDAGHGLVIEVSGEDGEDYD